MNQVQTKLRVPEGDVAIGVAFQTCMTLRRDGGILFERASAIIDLNIYLSFCFNVLKNTIFFPYC